MKLNDKNLPHLSQLDLNKLRVFSVVAEEGGLSGASERLLLTRSALSQSLSALEASLGLSLFHRVGRRMWLSAEGKELLARWQDSQRQLEAALESITGRTRMVQGMVRVGLFVGFSRAKLTDFLARFLATHPAVQVKLLFVSQPELGQLLLENRIDFALSIYPLSSQARTLSSVRLFEEELVLVAAKRHFRERPSLLELQKLPLVDYYQNGQMARTWVKHHFGKTPARLEIRAFGAAIDFVLDLVLKEVGAGIVPKHAATPYLRKRQLFQIRTGKPELRDSVWLNELSGFRHTRAARLFHEALQTAFNQD